MARSRRRVLLTRAADDNQALALALTQAGYDVVCVPCVARAPLDVDTASWPPAPHLLLLTSATAARVCAGAPIQPARVAAVGPKTAAAAAAVGFVVTDLLTDDPSGERLVEALGPLRGETVLWPRPAEAAGGTERALAQAGAIVVAPVVYENQTPPDLVDALRAASPVDAVVFASPSAARRFATATPARPPAITIGQTTERTACELGFEQTQIAPGLKPASVVAALARLLP